MSLNTASITTVSLTPSLSSSSLSPSLTTIITKPRLTSSSIISHRPSSPHIDEIDYLTRCHFENAKYICTHYNGVVGQIQPLIPDLVLPTRYQNCTVLELTTTCLADYEADNIINLTQEDNKTAYEEGKDYITFIPLLGLTTISNNNDRNSQILYQPTATPTLLQTNTNNYINYLSSMGMPKPTSHIIPTEKLNSSEKMPLTNIKLCISISLIFIIFSSVLI